MAGQANIMNTNQREQAIVKAVIIQVRFMAIAAVVVGAIPGWASVFFLGSEAEVSVLAGRIFFALYLVLPAILYITATLALRSLRQASVDNNAILITELAAAVVGALLGSLVYILVVLFLASVFGGMNWAMVQSGLLDLPGFLRIVGLIAVTAVSAIPVAMRIQRQL